MTLPLFEQCFSKHVAIGTLGYPEPPLNIKDPHMSVRTCGEKKCVASANRAIRKVTGHDGVLTTFAEARARARTA